MAKSTYTIRIYTGPAWVRQYVEVWDEKFSDCKVWAGTEHAYIEGVKAIDGPAAVKYARRMTGANLADIDSKRTS